MILSQRRQIYAFKNTQVTSADDMHCQYMLKIISKGFYKKWTLAIKMSGSFGCIKIFKDLCNIIDNPKTVDSCCVSCNPFTI